MEFIAICYVFDSIEMDHLLYRTLLGAYMETIAFDEPGDFAGAHPAGSLGDRHEYRDVPAGGRIKPWASSPYLASRIVGIANTLP